MDAAHGLAVRLQELVPRPGGSQYHAVAGLQLWLLAAHAACVATGLPIAHLSGTMAKRLTTRRPLIPNVRNDDSQRTPGRLPFATSAAGSVRKQPHRVEHPACLSMSGRAQALCALK